MEIDLRLEELAHRIGATVVGDGSIEVRSASTLEDAEAGQISFLANPKYARQLETTRASAVIASPKNAAPNLTLLHARDPYFAFAQAVVILHGHRQHPHVGIHPKAHVDPTATIGQGTVVYPGVFIGPRVRIGQDCILYPNVVVYDDCVLGDRVIIQANATIGGDGFGYATHKGEHFKIPQVGNVVIQDDVEIGANTAIDRAALGSTVIGQGTKLDNLVAVGHGTQIGPHGLVVAQVGIAGSVMIGHHVTLAGQVGIAGHLKIGDNVTIAAKGGVMSDVPDQSVLMGQPVMPLPHARRVYAAFMQLPDLVKRVKALEAAAGKATDEEDQVV